MKVGFYDDPLFREHDAGEGHPESPQRLDAVARAGEKLRERLLFQKTRKATREELLRVHTQKHVDAMAKTAGKTVRLDPDTQASPHSYDAALLAAGTVTDAVDQVLSGGLERAFCAVRPPGHHAEADKAMGFCLLNNVAVAAAHAIAKGLSRVMVIDFDVHHGNGTQHIFERDKRVLYLSSHAFPFYPGTGSIGEMGEGEGKGFTVNLPMPAGCGDAEYARVYREFVEPIGRSFDPELLIVSAGYDAGQHDPLAPMNVTPAGFAEISDACLATAAGSARGRAVFALEGGYSMANLRDGASASLRCLLGEKHERLSAKAHPSFDRLLGAFRKAHEPHWPVVASR